MSVRIECPPEPSGWVPHALSAPAEPDPSETCVMRPGPAGSPMDLCLAPQGIPLEDISPPLASHVASTLASLHDIETPDPFEGSALSGIALPAVAARPASAAPTEKEVLLWSLVRTGGGYRPKKGPAGLCRATTQARIRTLHPHLHPTTSAHHQPGEKNCWFVFIMETNSNLWPGKFTI